jgi:hypothetical protein
LTNLADDAKDHALIRQTLQRWQNDPDLADIRNPAAVVNLPGDEQEACKKLWTGVAELVKKLEAMK